MGRMDRLTYKSLIDVEVRVDFMRRDSTTSLLLTSVLCVLMFSFSGLNMVSITQVVLDEEEVVARQSSSQPVRIEISSEVNTITADEVNLFSAELYDAVNNLVSGDVVWSCSNGSITSDGMFYPWNSGTISVQASHNGLIDTFNISVTAGVGQSLQITSLSAQALAPVSLTADLLDARGNSKASSGVTWTIDGEYVGVGSPAWTPDDVGQYLVQARLYQMEHVATIEVTAGSPYEFVFDTGMQVRSGSSLLITPRLLDSNGFEMNVTEAGNRVWEVENGSIIPSGWFTATHPGVWAVNVSAGNVTGSGLIRVVPADASLSQVTVLSDSDVYVAGISYELVAMRTDSLGYTGTITPLLENFSVTSGGLSLLNGRVYWTPGSMGTHEIQVNDEGAISSLSVEVTHGNAIDTSLELETNSLVAGEQSTVAFYGIDVMGNEWIVNGSLTLVNGNSTQYFSSNGFATITPQEVTVWRIEGSWYDLSTDTRFESVFQMQSNPGNLALIQLNGEGAVLPADTALYLDPKLYDGYSNPLDAVALNWTVDGVDATVDILLSDLYWIPTTIGGHEIRANADGIFATVRLTVVAGEARSLVTDFEDGIIVSAGVPSELFIQTIDAHGNLAPATNVEITLESEFGILEASSSGNGYWDFTGQTAGSYTLDFVQDEARHSIPLTINPGVAVRLISTIENLNIDQGDTVLLRIQGADAFDNIVEVEPENTTVSCTSGSSSHVTTDTWELDISTAGNDRSCNILWNGLLSQNFFDVESVLLGGAVGSTNTAMGLGIFLLSLILVTLVVLVRKANRGEEQEWVEDAFDDDYEDDYDEDDDEDQLLDESAETKIVPPLLSDELRSSLAKKAAEVGVMQATPDTVQGSSGWYVDVSSEVQYWNVGEDGSWTRVE